MCGQRRTNLACQRHSISITLNWLPTSPTYGIPKPALDCSPRAAPTGFLDPPFSADWDSPAGPSRGLPTCSKTGILQPILGPGEGRPFIVNIWSKPNPPSCFLFVLSQCLLRLPRGSKFHAPAPCDILIPRCNPSFHVKG